MFRLLLRALANISLAATRALKDLERRETEGWRSKSIQKAGALED
jgi:hypothetical protein